MNFFSAVIVTYNPNLSQLKACVSSLFPQVEKIVIVKNSSEKLDFSEFQNEKIIQIQLEKNFGIAYAQNRGIEKTIKLGSEWILLSDQDTVFPENYVADFERKIKSFGKSKIYAPTFFNEVKNQKEPVSVSMLKPIVPSGSEAVKVLHAISSGMIFCKEVFQKIGGMKEELFIDYVDFEFCWRARKIGIETLCFPDISIHHQLGDSYKKILGKKITLRSDFRYFYMLRNGLCLSKNCECLSDHEKSALCRRTLIFAFGIILISKNKLKALKLVKNAVCESKKMGDER